MATVAVPNKTKLTGGSFLIQEHSTNDVFTLEDLSEEHRQIAQTTEEFARNEILPNVEKIEHKEFAVTRGLIRKACEIGIANVDIPEQYGGSDMDKISSAIIAEHMSVSGSFSVAFGGHTGIGTLPIVYFGTPEQKAKYLPKLATGELIAAYALSESTSASDAMNARTKAVLSADGKEWVLNGEKMWITNGGFADVVIIFAKVDGEKFTRVYRGARLPGFPIGRGREKDGHSRLIDNAHHPERLPRTQRKPAGRDRQRARHRLQHAEHRALQAGRGRDGRRAQLAEQLDCVCQAAQGLRQDAG